MIEIYQSVELTWGAPDLALYESLPHSIRSHGGANMWKDDPSKDEIRAHMRELGKSHSKRVLFMGIEFDSMTAAADHFDIGRDRVRRGIRAGLPGCRVL